MKRLFCLFALLRMHRFKTHLAIPPSDRTEHEHSEILTAIRERQSEAARQAMENHLLRASEDLGFSAEDISE